MDLRSPVDLRSPSTTPSLAHPSFVDPPVPIAPFALWLLLQLGCLAIALLLVPLGADVILGETQAVRILLTGQVGGIAILSPALCRSWRSSMAVIASTWPMLFIAAAAQGLPAGAAAACGMSVTVWVGLLTVAMSFTSRPASRRSIGALATVASIGMLLLGYLSMEFADPASATDLPHWLNATPIFLAWTHD